MKDLITFLSNSGKLEKEDASLSVETPMCESERDGVEKGCCPFQ